MTAEETFAGWLHGAKASRLLGVFAKLRIADLLADGARTPETLAVACQLAPDRMNRLLRGFVELGLCTVDSEAFGLTAPGSQLRYGSALYDMVLLLTDPVTELSWARLEDGARSGRGGFHEAFGMSIFEYMDGKPELRARYDAVMSGYTTVIAEEIAEHHDFGRYTAVTDIGGGDGTLLAVLQRHHPHLRGTVFDRADGDFLRSVPAGSDLYLLKWILHNWPDDDAVTILRNCRTAMDAHSRMLVVERILADRDPDLADLHMWMIYGGKERTRQEFSSLCASADLSIVAVTPLPSGMSVIEVATST